MNNLELILLESIAGFAAGFKHGMKHAKIVSALDLKEVSGADQEKVNELRKDLYKTLQKIELKESGLAGLAVGLINLGLTLNPQLYVNGLFATGISAYLGLKAGRSYSKFRSSRAKITPEEDSMINIYLENFKTCYKSDDEKFEKLEGELKKYCTGIIERTGSPKLFKEIQDRIRPVVRSMCDYRNVKRFTDTPEDGVAAMHINKTNDKNAPVDILILHDGKIYKMNAEDIKKVGNEEDFSRFIEGVEQIPWDGSVDKLFNYVQDLGNYHSMMLFNGSNEVPLEAKLSIAKMNYNMRKMFR